MTTEQKFKKLLDIAIENGFDPHDQLPYNFAYILLHDFNIFQNTLKTVIEGWSENREFHSKFSMHDLVLNTNFFECLFKQSDKLKLKTDPNTVIIDIIPDTMSCKAYFPLTKWIHYYKFQWIVEIEKGTALDWLFEQFDIW